MTKQSFNTSFCASADVLKGADLRAHLQERSNRAFRPCIQGVLCCNANALLQFSKVHRCKRGDNVERWDHALAVWATQMCQKQHKRRICKNLVMKDGISRIILRKLSEHRSSLCYGCEVTAMSRHSMRKVNSRNARALQIHGRYGDVNGHAQGSTSTVLWIQKSCAGNVPKENDRKASRHFQRRITGMLASQHSRFVVPSSPACFSAPEPLTLAVGVAFADIVRSHKAMFKPVQMLPIMMENL